MSMLFYMIPKVANWKNINDDSAIAISYKRTEAEEKFDIDGMELSRIQRGWIASQMGLPPLFVIPIDEETYFRLKADKVSVTECSVKNSTLQETK